jgi:hypothetical protein
LISSLDCPYHVTGHCGGILLLSSEYTVSSA